ncbi:MAG: hypothetical protein JXA93_01560 [Anaerolineae bacterium]|nr:hypothetical protein [Anaerolineae bacterium]
MTRRSRVSGSALLLGAAVISLLAIESLLFSLTVDDAYISFRYSENLARGHGLVWNSGDAPVEGYTNFLWVLMGAAFDLAGLPLVLSMKASSVALSLVTIVLLYHTTRLLAPTSNYAAIPALLFASMPSFALWAVGGLETALFIFLLVCALYVFFREESDADNATYYWSSLYLTLLALTRPEGVAVFGVLVLLRLASWIKQGVARRQMLRYLAWVGAFGTLYVIYFAWRWWYFGYPLPNTAYVKASSGAVEMAGHVAIYLIPYILRIFPFVLLAIYGLCYRERIVTQDLYLVGAIAALALLNLVGSDWMPGHRLALPITPLILLLARGPLDWITHHAFMGSVRKRATHAVILASLLLYAVAPLLYTANLFQRVMATQMNMSIYRWALEMRSIVDGQYVQVGQWLAENAPPDATIVAGNVGAIGYLSRHRVVDMIGLTDAYIARNGWTVAYLLDQEPEFVVLESDTPNSMGGLYGTGGERFITNDLFLDNYELLFILDNHGGEELGLFLHHLPHVTWLFARRDLGLSQRAISPAVE